MHTSTIYRATSLLFLASTAMTQTIAPSNGTQDLYPVSTSPRFLLNGTQMPDLPPISLAPLGNYARMSHNAFVSIEVTGYLKNLNGTNAHEDPGRGEFAYVSCDPEAYNPDRDVNDVFRIVVNQPRANIVILYSETSDHCAADGLDNLPQINGILTTTEAMAATMLADLQLSEDSPGSVTITPDLNAYTNSSNDPGFTNGFNQSPTTAVAMIILYSITGIITALFVVIIVTGAIRAHRHPERYGPRTIVGRGRQSRARGIARAMLETLPIVKFGDRDTPDPTRKESTDIEMHAPNRSTQPSDENPSSNATESNPNPNSTDAVTSTPPSDGTTEEGQLGCSICTDDFTKGEEVRVLPCNHKFHPDCVDPWLLNVSGTCPLCRIDLRPSQTADGEAGDDPRHDLNDTSTLPPPLARERSNSVSGIYDTGPIMSLRRDTMAQLFLGGDGGSSEDRIAALRRFRQERRSHNNAAAGGSGEQDEGERRGLARRLRERFRIRTERRGGEGVGEGSAGRRGTTASGHNGVPAVVVDDRTARTDSG